MRNLKLSILFIIILVVASGCNTATSDTNDTAEAIAMAYSGELVTTEIDTMYSTPIGIYLFVEEIQDNAILYADEVDSYAIIAELDYKGEIVTVDTTNITEEEMRDASNNEYMRLIAAAATRTITVYANGEPVYRHITNYTRS